MNLAFGHEVGSNKVQDIPASDQARLRSAYLIASSDGGKSSMLETWIHQDIHDGVGHAVFDVEDRLTARVIRHYRDAGVSPVIIDPTRAVIPLNILAPIPGVKHSTIVEHTLQTFQKFWSEAWGSRTEDFLRHMFLLFLELGLTLGEAPRFMSNQAFRDRVAAHSQDARVRLYFIDHLKNMSPNQFRAWIESPRNKMGALMSNEFIAPCLTAQSCLDLGRFMDDGTPVVVNLPEKSLGESGKLMGALIVSRFYQLALNRADGARPYFNYVDEFQTLMTPLLLNSITRARKRSLGHVLAHQTISQEPFNKHPDYISTILGTAAIVVVMQIGREDSERFAKELFPSAGVHVKRRKSHPIWGDFGDPQFYSVQEEREQQMDELQGQRQRECFIRVKERRGTKVYIAEAYELPEPISTPEEGELFANERVEAVAVSLDEVQAAQQARMARFSARGSRQQS